MQKILLIFTVSVIISACKKDSNSHAEYPCQITKFNRMDTGYGDYDQGDYDLSYNSEGNLDKITSSSGTRSLFYEEAKTMVTYGNNNILTYAQNIKNQINYITTNKGSEKVYVSYENDRISKIRTTIDNITENFTYNKNGDIEKVVHTWDLDKEPSEYTISYKDEKYTNPLIFELTFPNLINGDARHFLKYILSNNFGGKEKRLIDKITSKNSNNSATNYSYVKDKKGNITKIVASFSGAGYSQISSSDVVYDCK